MSKMKLPPPYQGLAKFTENFINTYQHSRKNPESLTDAAAVNQFLGQHGIVPPVPVTEKDLPAIYQLRTKLRTIWSAERLEIAQAHTNQLLAYGSIRPELAQANASQLYLDFRVASDVSTLHEITIKSAVGMGVILQYYGLASLRTCAAPPCQVVFIDTSRNQSRRYCADRCANRHNIAAYRQRQRVKSNH